MSFQNLGLQNEILQVLDEKGYMEATSIQTLVIPQILKGGDILASAQTGTGKTASFALPLLQLLMIKKNNQKSHRIRGLILTPTRELAAQVAENVRTYGKYLPLKAQVIFGGVNIHAQIKKLQNGTDILIATPGRLLDLVSQKIVDLSHVEILIIDEADRMMDMGFIRDMKKIIALLPKNRQNLLFSATLSTEIKGLAYELLKSPQTIEVARSSTPNELVSHVVYPVDKKRKYELLSFLISSQNWEQVLVFVRTKHGADRLAKQLTADKIAAEGFHGNKSQFARTKALQRFKKGLTRVLVATDIASRGIDIDQLQHVVNFELPDIPEDYIHRIGRTGRAGNKGFACSLVCVDEHRLLSDIERLLKQEIPRLIQVGYEPDPSIAAQSSKNRHSNQAKAHSKNNDQKSHMPKKSKHAKHKSTKSFFKKNRKTHKKPPLVSALG
jgi:ATP-dependent RNA helicase RhlE